MTLTKAGAEIEKLRAQSAADSDFLDAIAEFVNYWDGTGR
tara:strand:+ start:12240 stop:12359 length:120 start_codon:yes stop_codon:yes gene_type:complete